VEATFNQKILAHFDANEAPMVDITATWSGFEPQVVTLTGCIQDCSLAPCSPIQ